MKQLLLSALIFGSAAALSGCGFTPVYGSSMNAEEGSIQISQIDGRSGQILRRELLMLLRPGLPNVDSGALDVTLQIRSTDFAIQPAGANSRTNTTLRAKYTLTTPEGTLTGRVSGFTSFAAPQSPYADIMARRNAEDRAAVDVARNLVTELQLRLASEERFAGEDTVNEGDAEIFGDEDDFTDVGSESEL